MQNELTPQIGYPKPIEHLYLSEHQRVLIGGLGDGKFHPATVRGVFRQVIDYYILEPDSPLNDSQFGTCVLIPECNIILPEL